MDFCHCSGYYWQARDALLLGRHLWSDFCMNWSFEPLSRTWQTPLSCKRTNDKGHQAWWTGVFIFPSAPSCSVICLLEKCCAPTSSDSKSVDSVGKKCEWRWGRRGVLLKCINIEGFCLRVRHASCSNIWRRRDTCRCTNKSPALFEVPHIPV